MRIAFCFLIVLCTVYAASSEDLEILKKRIQSVIRTVEDDIQQIKYFHDDISQDIRVTITKRWWEQQDNLKEYINLLLTSMRRELNNAKLKGADAKEAQDCYNTNEKGLGVQTDKVNEKGVECKKKAKTSTDTSLGFLDNMISLGDMLIEDLNNILPNCHDGEEVKMQSCILTELGKIDSAVKSFEKDIKYIRYNAMSTSDYIVLQATKCLSNAYLLAHIYCHDSATSHSRCLQNLLDKKK